MKKYKYILLSIIAITVFNINNVFAETFDANVTIKPSLTLDISSDKISMNLDPASKAVDEQDLVVKVGTNNNHGYKLYASSNGTDLINIADSGKTIPNLTSSFPLASMPTNSWGYRLTQNSESSTGDYGVFTSGAIVSESDVPVNNNVATLGFASKIDYTMPSGTYELTLNFKALPIVTQNYMQNLDPKVCTEDPTVVIDKRDGQTYTISRLKDGNCWMTQNLKLGKYSDSMAITPDDSNTATNKTISGKLSYPVHFPVDSNVATYDGWAYYCTPNSADTENKYETCYYNWYTATAGYGTSATTSEVEYSICPSGWGLPNISQAERIVNDYLYDAQLVTPSSSMENANGFIKPGFLLADGYNNNGPYSIGTYGTYWTKTPNTDINVKTFVVWYNSNGGANTARKMTGFAVRCILTEN